MASLKDIRRRISSVKNTQQITKAMKVVAAAKLRRAQQAIAGARPYTEKLAELTSRIIDDLLASAPNLGDEQREAYMKTLHPLLSSPFHTEEGKKPKAALVVVSSDRGLCGAYNANAIKASFRRYNELSETHDVQLVFVGKRGYEWFNKRGFKGTWHQEFWAGKFTNKRSDELALDFMEKYLAGEFARVEAVYTQFRSAISQTVVAKQMLPLGISVPTGGAKAVATTEADYRMPYLYEPKREEILADLLPSLVKMDFYRIFADSLASQFGAQMTSMDNASRNAGSMISRLTLEANRVRQASITKELMEIVSGAEALKG